MYIAIFVATFVLVLLTVYGLVTSATWLSIDLVANVPLGNLMVAVSLIAMSIINLIFFAKGSIRRKVAMLVLVIAFAWYPIGIIWSGNLRLNFVSYGEYWHPFSYFTGLTVFAVLALNILWSLVHKKSQ